MSANESTIGYLFRLISKFEPKGDDYDELYYACMGYIGEMPGYGLRGIFTDAIVNEFVNNPKFFQNQLIIAILKFFQSHSDELKGEISRILNDWTYHCDDLKDVFLPSFIDTFLKGNEVSFKTLCTFFDGIKRQMRPVQRRELNQFLQKDH